MLKELNWETLAERREKNQLTMMYKIQSDIVDIRKESYVKAATNTSRARSSHKLRLAVPFARPEIYKNSFFPQTTKNWNSLENSIVNAPTLDSFKRARGTIHISTKVGDMQFLPCRLQL